MQDSSARWDVLQADVGGIHANLASAEVRRETQWSGFRTTLDQTMATCEATQTRSDEQLQAIQAMVQRFETKVDQQGADPKSWTQSCPSPLGWRDKMASPVLHVYKAREATVRRCCSTDSGLSAYLVARIPKSSPQGRQTPGLHQSSPRLCESGESYHRRRRRRRCTR